MSDYELLDVSSIRHKDGIPWHDAPAPPRMHSHWAQTTSNRLDRCACGATRFFDDPIWIEEIPSAARFAEEVRSWWRFWQ
jgi:hypothetical protein